MKSSIQLGSESDSDPEPTQGLILTEEENQKKEILELKIENKLLVQKSKDLNEKLNGVIDTYNYLIKDENQCNGWVE